jgi:RHS repeat-associated protein
LTSILQKVGAGPNPPLVLQVTLNYDVRNRLLHRQNQNGSGTTLSDFVYTRRDNGQIQTLTETVLQPNGTTQSTTASYGYDALGRLVHEQSTTQVLATPPGPTTSYTTDYTLDLVGNRLHKLTTRSDSTVERVDGTFDARDRLRQQLVYPVATGGTPTNTITFQYDVNGSLTLQSASAGSSLTQTWDVRGRLATATNVQGTTTMVGLYRYDPDGIRMREEVTTTTTTGSTHDVRVFVVDQQSPAGYSEVIEERGPDGRVIATYVYGSSLVPISLARTGQPVGLYVADVHSGVRQVVDLSGATVLAADRYDAFGVTVAQASQPGFVNIVGYQGERFDSVVGQVYLRDRLYDPATGRFTSMDPYVGDSLEPLTFHKYVYAQSDPMNRLDPSGQFGLAGFFAGFALASHLRNIKIGVDLAIFDAVVTAVRGVETGQTALQILTSFAINELTGLVIGYLGNKFLTTALSVWENGITIVLSASRRAAANRALIFLNSGQFHIPRLPKDLAVTGRPARQALSIEAPRINSAFQSPVQRERAQEWVNWAKSVAAADIRVTQAQVSTEGRVLGKNVPDIQFTLKGGRRYTLPNGTEIEIPAGGDRRIYIELDVTTSGRGTPHLKRILANDPNGGVILETTNENGILASLLVK